MRELCDRFIPVAVSSADGVKSIFQRKVASLPLQVLYFCPRNFAEAVENAVQTDRFDLAHVQLARMGPTLDFLGRVPSVIDFVDALSLNMFRRAEREVWPKTWLFDMEGRRMACYEQCLIKKTSMQMVNSPVDKKALGDHATIHVVPNGVAIEDYRFRGTRRGNQDIIFSGNMDYFPNVDAAVFFAEEVFPLVRVQFPRSRLLIAGANPTGRVSEFGNIPGVVVTGAVPDLRSHIQDASVAVSPTRAGSGMQLKILEAMALGTPVVATSRALGGAAVENEKHLLIAETAEEFSRQVIRLLRDEALQERLAGSAREMVEKDFTWKESAKRLEMVYEQAMITR